jgi:glycogen synthase
MRICIVTREYPPVTPRSGGIGFLYSALAPELARQGHEVCVVTAADSNHGPRHLNGVRLSVGRPPPSRFWVLEELLWGRSATKLVREAGPFDVVFAPEWGGEAWRYAFKKSSGPLVTNLVTSLAQIIAIEGWRSGGRSLRARHRIQLSLEKAQSERSDAIVACTQRVLDWSRQIWRIDDTPSVVLPCMIDVPGVRQASAGEPPEAMQTRAPTILFAGRLERRKGAHVIGPAMSEVWEQHPDAQLVMIGEDSEGPPGWPKMSEYLRHVARSRPSNLHLLGHQPIEAMYTAMAAADIVALPSLWENFSLTSLAAMAIGCPLILTTGGGYEEFSRADVDSLMVPPGETDALAAAIVRMLESPDLRRRLGESARERSEQYDVPVVTRRYADYFATVAS